VPDLTAAGHLHSGWPKTNTDRPRLGQIGEELVDRFGKLPKQVEKPAYYRPANRQLLAGQLGVNPINMKKTRSSTAFGPTTQPQQVKLPVVEKWLKVGTSQIRLDLRYLTHPLQKAIEDVSDQGTGSTGDHQPVLIRRGYLRRHTTQLCPYTWIPASRNEHMAAWPIRRLGRSGCGPDTHDDAYQRRAQRAKSLPAFLSSPRVGDYWG